MIDTEALRKEIQKCYNLSDKYKQEGEHAISADFEHKAWELGTIKGQLINGKITEEQAEERIENAETVLTKIFGK